VDARSDAQEAIKNDNAAAEQLVDDQLMFHLLQRAMSEVVRSQADGVLTGENTPVFRAILYSTMIILPRQARDTQREDSPRDVFSDRRGG
jgi:hypothetical protein